jgi:hypothetical protein
MYFSFIVFVFVCCAVSLYATWLSTQRQQLIYDNWIIIIIIIVGGGGGSDSSSTSSSSSVSSISLTEFVTR